MLGINRWVVVVLLIAALPLAANAGGGKMIGKDSGIVPARVEDIPGSEVRKVVLTADAAERIGLQMSVVEDAQVPTKRRGKDRVTRQVVPYASIIYTPDGREWLYASPEKLTFIRTEIKIAYIKGDLVVLSEGPPAGMQVLTVGAAEVYGAEFGLGH